MTLLLPPAEFVLADAKFSRRSHRSRNCARFPSTNACSTSDGFASVRLPPLFPYFRADWFTSRSPPANSFKSQSVLD